MSLQDSPAPKRHQASMPEFMAGLGERFRMVRLYNVPVRLIDQILFGYYLVPDFLFFLWSNE